MSKRQEFETFIEEQLALWSARRDALKSKIGDSAELKSLHERWQALYEKAVDKLALLKSTTGDEWDKVKTVVTEAWTAISGVLDGGPRPDVTLTKEEIATLSPDQQDAVLEALVVAVVSDAKVGTDEVARFDKEIGSIPWAQPKQAIVDKAQAAQARVLALKTDEERIALLKSIAARLAEESIAEKTVRMMARVMSSDAPANPTEKNVLAAFALAFGIPSERLATLTA